MISTIPSLFLNKSRYMYPGGGGGVLTINLVGLCMCRPMLERRGLTELTKLKKWVLLELKADRTGENGCIQQKWVLLELIDYQVGVFRANKTQKGGLNRGTYPFCFNMGNTPSPPGTCTSLLLTGFCWT